MKNILIILGIVTAIGTMIFGVFTSTNNRAISLEEQVISADSDIMVQEKRRTDLIYNLVDCVKRYDQHEADTLLAVVNGRKSENNMDISEVSTQISAVAEAYPELKSNENYKELMNELSITENLIAEHRKTYNNQVRAYNKFVRKYPQNKILDFMGYEPVDYQYLEYSEEERQPINNLFGD